MALPLERLDVLMGCGGALRTPHSAFRSTANSDAFDRRCVFAADRVSMVPQRPLSRLQRLEAIESSVIGPMLRGIQ